jgi:hypothetical protein
MSIGASAGSSALQINQAAIQATASVHDPALRRDGLSLHTAHSLNQQRMAQQLVGRRYAARGYQYSAPAEANAPNQITLNASAPDSALATLTVRFDSSLGLYADAAFGAEVDALRRAERKLCEFTKLALADDLPSQRILGALFHMAYIHAHHMRRCDVGVIEVNPRHVGYYRRMLGFNVCSEPRTNLRVQAPAVLLCVEFDHIRTQLARIGNRTGLAAPVRNLYAHAFSAEEEQQLLEALQAQAPAHGTLLS